MQEKPLLSQCGNPYPPGLPPVHIDRDGYGLPLDVSAYAVDEEVRGAPDPWLYVTPNPKYPKLPLHVAPRTPGETEAQYAYYRENIERFHHDHTMLIAYAMQLLCTHLGNHRTCTIRVCRRRGSCGGARLRAAGMLATVPPCVPLDVEIIWTYWEEVRRELRRLKEAGEGGTG